MIANQTLPAERELRPLWESAVSGKTRSQRIQSRAFVCEQILGQVSAPVTKEIEEAPESDLARID